MVLEKAETNIAKTAIMAMISASFALDVVDRVAVQRNFETVARLTGHVPVFDLVYQRDFSKLPQLIDKITEFRLG